MLSLSVSLNQPSICGTILKVVVSFDSCLLCDKHSTTCARLDTFVHYLPCVVFNVRWYYCKHFVLDYEYQTRQLQRLAGRSIAKELVQNTARTEYTGTCCHRNPMTRSIYSDTCWAALATGSSSYHIQNHHTCFRIRLLYHSSYLVDLITVYKPLRELRSASELLLTNWCSSQKLFDVPSVILLPELGTDCQIYIRTWNNISKIFWINEFL